MLFTLEALNADHGDALLLHYGTTAKPQTMMIDGGPKGVFQKSVKPRLEALKKSRGATKPLPLTLIMVSHIDDDHITGVLDLLNGVIASRKSNSVDLVSVQRLWHNSFGKVTGGATPSATTTADVGTASVEAVGWDLDAHAFDDNRAGALVLVSVKQGVDLESLAKQLTLTVNTPFFPDLVSSEPNLPPIKFSDLTLKVIGPSKARLKDLQAKWAQDVKKIKDASVTPADFAVQLADYSDKTPTNLSSIVVLAACGGRTMLLTGDARGDYVLDVMKEQKVLAQGKLHVDVLKMQHHGSDRDVASDFLETVTADHYVISANGKYDNPDVDTLKMLVAARGSAKYTIHMTNHVPAADKYLKQAQKKGNFAVVWRAKTALSLKVSLGEALVD